MNSTKTIEDIRLKEAFVTCWNGDSIVVAHYYLAVKEDNMSGLASYAFYPSENKRIRIALMGFSEVNPETPIVIFFADVDKRKGKKDELVYIFGATTTNKMNGHGFLSVSKHVLGNEAVIEYEHDDAILKPLWHHDYDDDPWGRELQQLSGSIGGKARPFDKEQIRQIMEKSFPVK